MMADRAVEKVEMMVVVSAAVDVFVAAAAVVVVVVVVTAVALLHRQQFRHAVQRPQNFPAQIRRNMPRRSKKPKLRKRAKRSGGCASSSCCDPSAWSGRLKARGPSSPASLWRLQSAGVCSETSC
jgi:uncharacterized membrane protein